MNSERKINLDEEIIARARPKCITARQVKAFDQETVLKWFRENQVDFSVNDSFVLCENHIAPSTEICWDVCKDEKGILHVSLYYYDLGDGEGAGNKNSIEAIFAPYGDCHAYLQCGVTGTGHWTSEFWPFTDGRENLAVKFAKELTLSFHTEPMREITERMVTFHIPAATVSVAESNGLIGFNMMRCNLVSGENATWSPTCGAAFPDASGFGSLRLSDSAPMPVLPPLPKPLEGPVQLQVEYDWPDEMVGGPYTIDALRNEFKFLKNYGVGRIYWIDYPEFDSFESKRTEDLPFAHSSIITEHERQTYGNFGKTDTMFMACKLAHELGLEFFTTIKPYDLSGNNTFCQTNGKKFGFRRNPAWTDPQGAKEVRKLTLARTGDAPFEFNPADIAVYVSNDNISYTQVTGLKVEDKVLDYPNTVWTPNGNVPVGGTHKVRVLEFTGFTGKVDYIGLEFPKGNYSFRNFRYELFSCDTDKGQVRGMCSCLKKNGFANSASVTAKGVFEFIHDGAAAGWADATDSINRMYGFDGGGAIGIALSEIPTRGDMLDPTFAEVREYWCDFFIKRAVKAGADGVDVRIANHHVASDWLAYCYAEPVLEQFRTKFGREPECSSADFEAMRRIRGAGHTQFLRDAAKILHAEGKKLEAHVEARMKAPPSIDAYQGIHYDWATWIDEGIVDGVNLKYLGPLNRFVTTEIMPRAQKRGMPVNVIAAYGDPRRFARTWEEDVAGIELCRMGGINGFNLYETWCYLRTTPDGNRMIRGNALQVFKALKPYARA